jgi:hypothetical protein
MIVYDCDDFANTRRATTVKRSERMKSSQSCCSYDFWTVAATKDELAFQLSSANSFLINRSNNEIHITHKYYDQAQYLLFRLNLHDPPPFFIINLSDLSSRLRAELRLVHKSSFKLLDEVVTYAIERILESVDGRYYHVNVLFGKTRWRFEA